jgi:hypothetical protein
VRVALLTCTGDRPGPFSRTERWMAAQTFPYAEWCVTDDGHVPTRPTMGQTYIRMEPGRDPKASFTANLRTGLLACRSYDAVAVIEDDDYYSQDYLARMIPKLVDHDLAGESHALYFHVRNRAYRYMHNSGHASLCQTVFRTTLIDQILQLLDDNSPFVDLRIWRLPVRKILKPSKCSVGLKGQSGRGGLGIGHRGEGPHWHSDPMGLVLRKRIGEEDASLIFREENQASELPYS